MVYTYSEIIEAIKRLIPADEFENKYLERDSVLGAYCRILCGNYFKHYNTTNSSTAPGFDKSLIALRAAIVGQSNGNITQQQNRI